MADFSAVFRIGFFSDLVSPSADLYETLAYEITNVSSGETLVERAPLVQTTPPTAGFAVDIDNVECPPPTGCAVDMLRTGYRANQGTENELYDLDPRTLDGYASNWLADVRPDTTSAFVASPDDFALIWVSANDSLYRPPRVFGFLRAEIPVFAVNMTKNRPADLLIEDHNGSGEFDAGDELIIHERPGGTAIRRFRYRIGFTAADPANSVPPAAGNMLRISALRPFATDDFFQFTLRPSSIDADQARQELDRIAVVPNPYVGASAFEPRSQIEGRGERRIQFIHLPPTCTIRIFNIRGELVKTIYHDGVVSDGAAWWDLRSEEQQDVAFGVYVFHVEAPGIGEHVGKFALVK